LSKHDHPEPKPPCSHVYGYGSDKDGQSALKFCARCDAVECALCSKEWRSGGLALEAIQAFREKVERDRRANPPPYWFPPAPIPAPMPKGLFGGEILCNHVLDAIGTEGGKASVR
jgi:hypothetical protein